MGNAVLALLLSLAGPPGPRRIVVAPGGLVPTLTAALRLARAGDTVVVTAGIYREPRIIVRIPVVIHVSDADVAAFDGGQVRGAHVLEER